MICRLMLTALFVLAFGSAAAQDKPSLKDQKEKISYIIGMDIGANFKKQSIEIDPDILAKGIKDGAFGAKPLLSETETREIMTAFEKEMRARRETAQKTAGEKNKRKARPSWRRIKRKRG